MLKVMILIHYVGETDALLNKLRKAYVSKMRFTKVTNCYLMGLFNLPKMLKSIT